MFYSVIQGDVTMIQGDVTVIHGDVTVIQGDVSAAREEPPPICQQSSDPAVPALIIQSSLNVSAVTLSFRSRVSLRH